MNDDSLSSRALGVRLPELKWLLPRSVLRAVGLVSSNDALHQRMPHDIPLVEMNKRDSFHAGNDVSRLDQSRHLSDRQIDLRDVSGDHGFAVISDSGQKHLHLFRRRVLRLVQNDKGIIQRPPRMNAIGAISITPRSRWRSTRSTSSMSYSAS